MRKLLIRPAPLLMQRQVLPAMAFFLGISTYAFFGRGLPYNLYIYAAVPATFCCLLFRMIRDRQQVA